MSNFIRIAQLRNLIHLLGNLSIQYTHFRDILNCSKCKSTHKESRLSIWIMKNYFECFGCIIIKLSTFYHAHPYGHLRHKTTNNVINQCKLFIYFKCFFLNINNLYYWQKGRKMIETYPVVGLKIEQF